MGKVIEFGPNQYQGMATRELVASTSTETPNVRGASISNVFGLQGIKFIDEVIDAAKDEFFFANFIKEVTAEPGTSQVSIPIKTFQHRYINATADVTENVAGTDTGAGSGTGTGPYANTVADISFTAYNPLSSVSVKILPFGGGYAIRNFDIHTNIINLLNEAKEDLGFWMGSSIEVKIAQQFGTADGNTYAQTGIRGTIQLYGGNATADSGLATGDVLTTDKIADASRYLKGIENWVRADASGKRGAFSLDTTIRKNPWRPTSSEPFVLFIGVQQEATLRKDSQFVNASEYGSDTVIQNGEIGRYLDTRIIVTTYVEAFGSNVVGPDDSTTATGLTDGMTRCILMKAGHAAAIAWGKRPELKVVDWAISDQLLIIVWAYYAITVLQSDAIVNIDVANL